MSEDNPLGANEVILGKDEEVFSGPAYFVNRSFVTMSPMGVRLTFGELSPEKNDRFRTAVYLNMIDAIALKEMLNKVLDNVEFSMEQLEPAVASFGKEPTASPSAEASK